ncbi:TPA: hypothetical protein ACTXW8_003667, partial [Legionella anisa]
SDLYKPELIPQKGIKDKLKPEVGYKLAHTGISVSKLININYIHHLLTARSEHGICLRLFLKPPSGLKNNATLNNDALSYFLSATKHLASYKDYQPRSFLASLAGSERHYLSDKADFSSITLVISFTKDLTSFKLV